MKEIKPGMIVETHEGLWVCFPRQKGKIGFVSYHKSICWKDNIESEEIINIFNIGKDCNLCGELLYSNKWKPNTFVQKDNTTYIYIINMVSENTCDGLLINIVTGISALKSDISLIGTCLKLERDINYELKRINKKWNGYKIINLFAISDIKPGMTIKTSSSKYKVVDDSGQLRLLNDKNMLIEGTIKDYWYDNLQPRSYYQIKEIIDENNKILYNA